MNPFILQECANSKHCDGQKAIFLSVSIDCEDLYEKDHCPSWRRVFEIMFRYYEIEHCPPRKEVIDIN